MYFLLILILFHLTGVLTYLHQKPLEYKLWTEKCKKKSVVLNDCNWCWCDARQRYQCKARVCNEVDMFGHFNDAIRDIRVGMKGHGSWRSQDTSCTPGVHYQRGNVLCVCNEDGDWPSPACRALFQTLYSVSLTGKTPWEPCTPNKIYLVGCNVCICPEYGSLDPKLCTTKECDDIHNPPLDVKNGPGLVEQSNGSVTNTDIYATCNPQTKYKLGCMKCLCIGNNELVCDKCPLNKTLTDQPIARKNYNSYCTGKKPGEIFKFGCNYCHCDRKLNLYCTAKNCIQPRDVKLKSQFKISNSIKFRNALAPPDDQNCLTGTLYKRNCNTCKCVKQKNGVKFVDCIVKNCNHKNPIEIQKHDCVEGTYYQLDCKFCYCYTQAGVKHQVCQIYNNCVQSLMFKENTKQNKMKSVGTQNGYCEPLHTYQDKCNTCRCLSDGKTFMCTSRVCVERSLGALPVDIVPVQMPYNEGCPAGHSYKLDCNICYCLSNGNAVCTTNNCTNDV